MISLLLAADAVAKLGAAIGGGIAAIGAGIGIGKLVVKQWMQWQDSRKNRRFAFFYDYCSRSC